MIRVCRAFDVTLTPKQVAEEINDMSSSEQAEVLNELARLCKEWHEHYVFQLDSISKEAHLSDEARQLMEYIGEYSTKP